MELVTQVLQPLLPLLAILWLVIHGFTARAPQPNLPDHLAAYQAAVADAAVRDDRNVYGGLLPITMTNNDLQWRSAARDQLLVVSFVSTDDADRYYRTADGKGRKEGAPPDRPRLWVTLAPELQRFCRRLGTQDPTERLKQYLGLSPDATKDWLVEMWVARDELFRPCPDPEVTDSVCSLRSSDTPPTVKNVPDYRLFLLSLYEQSYQTDRGAPWTGLGYTYDWAHGHGIGASEYMLVPGAQYEVQSVQRPASYYAAGPGR